MGIIMRENKSFKQHLKFGHVSANRPGTIHLYELVQQRWEASQISGHV